MLEQPKLKESYNLISIYWNENFVEDNYTKIACLDRLKYIIAKRIQFYFIVPFSQSSKGAVSGDLIDSVYLSNNSLESEQDFLLSPVMKHLVRIRLQKSGVMLEVYVAL